MDPPLCLYPPIALQIGSRRREKSSNPHRHVRKSLPRYAVPVFLRIVAEMTPIHNNKQNKVPLREEGVDPERVKAGDEILWVSTGGKTYVPFGRKEWDGLVGGAARL